MILSYMNHMFYEFIYEFDVPKFQMDSGGTAQMFDCSDLDA